MKNQRGITLVEILAVLVILSLVSLAVYKGVQEPVNQSKMTEVESGFRVLKKSIDSYTIEHGKFPDVKDIINNPTNTTIRDKFVADVSEFSDYKLIYSKQDANFLQLKTQMEKDPWNNPFYILFPKDNSQPIYIVSHGPDKKRGNYSTGAFKDDLLLIIEKK